MKQKFVLLRNPEVFSPNEAVFCLWVGSSKRDQIRKSLVENFAFDMGYIFRVWDETTDFELITLSMRFFEGSELPLSRLHRVDMSICEFYTRLKHSNIEAIAMEARQPKGIRQLQVMFDANFVSRKSREARSRQCQSVTRKNLKSESLPSWQNAAISFCLIIALMGLDAFVSWLFKF